MIRVIVTDDVSKPAIFVGSDGDFGLASLEQVRAEDSKGLGAEKMGTVVLEVRREWLNS
jgi:hypothetical protein